MSERYPVHPRTRQMHDMWRLRSLRKRESLGVKRVASRQGAKVATVIDVNEAGDIKIDRATDENGVGEWFTPLNGMTPEIGSVVATANIEGSLAVLGPIGQGAWRIRPDPRFAEPDDFDPQPASPGPGWDFATIRNRPFLGVDPMRPFVDVGAPPFFRPNFFYWNDHFSSGHAASTVIGREGWNFFGGGSVSYAALAVAQHSVRIQTSAVVANRAGLSLAAPATFLSFSPIGDFWEMWWVLELGQTTNFVLRVGLMNALDSSADPDGGVYFEASSVTNAWRSRIRDSGADLDTHTFDESLHLSHVIFSIRGEPLITHGDYQFTFTKWKHENANTPETGLGLVVEQEHAFVVGLNDIDWNAQPGLLITTSAAAAKFVDLDYAGGWHFGNLYTSM